MGDSPPYEFSITVTFMTQCWLAPSTYGDTTNPTFVSASPADNETAVVAGKSIVLNFSEKVDAETGNVTIYRTSDSAVVEAISVTGSQVTGSGTSTITVNPADDLAYSTEHYVLIDATAFDDASSNSYAGISDTTALSFTTATTPGAPGAAGESASGTRSGQSCTARRRIALDRPGDPGWCRPS